MKRNLLFLYSLLLALIPLGSVAQTATNDVLTFTTSKAVGETILINLQYEGQLEIKGLESVPASAPFVYNTSMVKLTDQTVTIKGQLSRIAIHNDQKLTSLSAPNHTTLEELYCVNNPSLTSLNLSGCNKLKYISIPGTGLKNTYLTQFIGSLPKVKDGKLNFYRADQKATHAYWTIQDIRDANAKGWHVNTTVGHDVVELYPDEIAIGVDPAVSETLSLCILGESENIPLISNIEGNPVIVSGDNFTPYTVKQKSVIIGGNIKLFKVEWQKNITSINLGKNRSLTHLVCTKGNVTELGLSECSSLNLVECYGNGIRGEATTRLMSTLPDRTSAQEPGKIYFVDEASTEAQQNSYSDTDLFLAKRRGWVVYRRLSNGTLEELKPTGTSYDQIAFTTDKKAGEDFCIITNPSKPISVRGLKLLATSESTPDKNAIVTAQDITLVGNVLSLVLTDQQITAFESKDNKELRALELSGNKLTKLDLSTFEKLEKVACIHNSFDKEGSAFTLSHLPDRTKEETPGVITFASTAEGDTTPTYSSADIAAANALNWKVMQRDNEGKESEIVPKVNVITLVTDKAVGSEVTIDAKLVDGRPVKVTGLSVAEITPANTGSKFTLTAQTVTLTGDITSLSIPDGEWTKIETTADYDKLETLAYPRNKVTAPVLKTPRLSMLDCRNNGVKADLLSQLIAQLPDRSAETNKGELRLFNTYKGAGETNEITAEYLKVANAKGWRITDSKEEITEQLLATELVLHPDSTDDTVYTLEGIRLFTPANELPEGIYIIGGKKVIINRTK